MSREAIQERLGSIVIAAQRMASTVTNLLDINAIETGNLNITCQPTDVEPIVRRCIADYTERAAAKKITLHYSPQSTSGKASLDASVMADILENLLSNALKYSPLGKNVFIRFSASNEAVRVEIEDEGPGLSADDKTKLFGKFARLSAQPTGGEHSTGLGLSIVKRFTEAMHGRVWCESELGAGATFIVEFPSCESEIASREQNNPNA
jgi:signal transduction histidine kinase